VIGGGVSVTVDMVIKAGDVHQDHEHERRQR